MDKNKWSADYVNDPFDDYNLIVEILYDEEDIAIIKQEKEGLEIKWYPNKEEISIPLDWFLSLLSEAQERLKPNTQECLKYDSIDTSGTTPTP